MTNNKDRLLGCLIGGAIGDAMGSHFENAPTPDPGKEVFIWGGDSDREEIQWRLSDDTQLTLATCQSIIEAKGVYPEKIAHTFLEWANQGKLSGLGSATVQAIQGLRNGGHWALVGKKGEQAAGNGAAMRIAPLAFTKERDNRQMIRDVARITHHNEEAYAGALAIIVAINFVLDGSVDDSIWLQTIANDLPDTGLRDRIIAINRKSQELSIQEIAQQFGNTGYVVDSVPLALFSVGKARRIGFEAAMSAIIETGGDVDTNASIFGQIAGAEIGYEGLPDSWKTKLQQMNEYIWMEPIVRQWVARSPAL